MKNKYITFKNIRYFTYILIFISFFIFYYLLANPIFPFIKRINQNINVSEENLRKHVLFLTNFSEQRTYNNFEVLNEVSNYIYDNFKESGCDKVYFQTFKVKDSDYKNVICYFKGKIDEKIVIGAHYDVFGEYTKIEGAKKMVFGTYAGADDNASGVSGLIELTRLIGENKNKSQNSIEFIAYTLEEPPFFDSEEMGSYVHAKSIYENKDDVKYMISLEMIGYFSDNKIQEYPIRFLSRIYPKEGNFIAIVGKFFNFEIKDIKKKMISSSDINVKSLSSPSFIQGIDFSDHRNYWHFGYNAFMITDTSFFRNKNYHTSGDTIETLDFNKMKEVVKGVYGIIIN